MHLLFENNDFTVTENPYIIKELKFDYHKSDTLDIITVLSRYLKNAPKEHTKETSQPVYRLQPLKKDDLEEMIVNILPIIDSFENILTHAAQFSDNEILENWMTSVEAIYKRLRKTLLKNGLQPIECIGIPVDFSIHEVVEYRHTPDGIPNLIIEEKQKGYTYKGKLIREARVVVSNAE
jgi:molecular chaperone GrpE (heat shock protein)